MSKHQSQVHASRRGFQYTLENGYRLSVMFDYGNYCDNRSWDYSPDHISDHIDEQISCENFEVAVFTPDDKFITLIDKPADEDGISRVEQVIGWVPAQILPNLIQRIEYFPDPQWKATYATFQEELKHHALAFGKACEDARDSIKPGMCAEKWDEMDEIASGLDLG